MPKLPTIIDQGQTPLHRNNVMKPPSIVEPCHQPSFFSHENKKLGNSLEQLLFPLGGPLRGDCQRVLGWTGRRPRRDWGDLRRPQRREKIDHLMPPFSRCSSKPSFSPNVDFMLASILLSFRKELQKPSMEPVIGPISSSSVLVGFPSTGLGASWRESRRKPQLCWFERG